ncbi:translation initiation factor IF-5A [Methanofollis sp. UBA420]|jgi:translation initiation factor 5A|uniref:translation initiation factor IF-5A n=1 Tax=Methanofollis sp. UBA420 TaxID=1915514 RepID=UPI00316AE033
MKEQTETGKLKEGRYVVVDDEPCKILGIATSKPGKHGAAKARIDVVGIFDGQKRSIVQPVSTKVYVPVVERKVGQVISITGTTVQMMDVKDFTMFEIEVPEDKVAEMEAGKEVQYIEALGKKKLDF